MKSEALDLRFTYQDYQVLPNDGKRYEIIDGELFMTPAPTTEHQRVSRKLGRVLDDFVTANNVGEVFYAPCDVVFSDTDIVQPDIMYISKERAHIITEKNIQGAPDLVVEITSPLTDKTDRTLKKTLYARYGVKEYWIVDPERKTVEVWVLSGSSYQGRGVFKQAEIMTSPLLGLEINLRQIF